MVCKEESLSPSNLILTFIESCCLVEEGTWCAQRELWDSFHQWQGTCGLFELGRNTFYQRLSEFAFREKGKCIGFYLKDSEDWVYWEPYQLRKLYLISDGEFVKIGVSSDPEYRKSILQIGSSRELSLLASFSGAEKEEKELHKKFAEKHERGEWFKLSSEDVLFIFGFFANKNI